MSRNVHLDYKALRGNFKWKTYIPHTYTLSYSADDHNEGLLLSAKAAIANGSADNGTLNSASPLDHMIWDDMVQKDNYNQCDCLTLWTKDIEFNIIFYAKENDTQFLKCAYFPSPGQIICNEHVKYWNTVHDKYWNTGEHSDFVNAKSVHENLPALILWNRYIKDRSPSTSNIRSASFTRYHAYMVDPFRHNLQTIPVPTRFLDENNSLTLSKICQSDDNLNKQRDIINEQIIVAADSIYRLILNRYDFIAACGSAVKRNLLTLASLLVDPNIRVALVTGEPGTGKEALCRAIYYGNKVRLPKDTEPESRFLQTTAIEIQSEMGDNKRGKNGQQIKGQTPTEFLRARLAADAVDDKINIVCPVIFIDELNKARSDFLAAMLRPLEQGEAELRTIGDPKYILAASQHIDQLAQIPPQDFWTRISHQLRVVHPLSRVSEEDGKVFLRSFFYATWWYFVQKMCKSYKESDDYPEKIIKTFIGTIENNKKKGKRWDKHLKLSSLCERVRDEFLNTLVPLVSRDTLSIRGARSILSQVFARISWYVRFQEPLKNSGKLGYDAENEIAELVNSAVQDVMAILNAARATPAGMSDRKSQESDRGT